MRIKSRRNVGPPAKYADAYETGYPGKKKLRKPRQKLHYPESLKNRHWRVPNVIDRSGFAHFRTRKLGRLEHTFRQNTVSAQRLDGDSEYGAELRFLNKYERETGHRFKPEDDMSVAKKVVEHYFGIKYSEWRYKREAQHFIPVSVARELGIPDNIIQRKENFAMLREGERTGRPYRADIEPSGDENFPKLPKSFIDHKTSYENYSYSEDEEPDSRYTNLLNKSQHIKDDPYHSAYCQHVIDVIKYMDYKAEQESRDIDWDDVQDVIRIQHKSGVFDFVDDMRDVKEDPAKWISFMEESIEMTLEERASRDEKNLMKRIRGNNRQQQMSSDRKVREMQERLEKERMDRQEMQQEEMQSEAMEETEMETLI